MKRKASAVWHGDIKQGGGYLNSQSGVLNKTPYSFHTRFGDVPGTNPEELMAAAHAGCFTMKFDLDLTEAGYAVESLKTDCHITIDEGKITLSELTLEAKIPGISEEDFQRLAQGAKETCPVSVAYGFDIQLTASLV